MNSWEVDALKFDEQWRGNRLSREASGSDDEPESVEPVEPEPMSKKHIKDMLRKSGKVEN